MFDPNESYSEAVSDLVQGTGAPHLVDALRSRIESPPLDLDHAVNKNQIACKKWLLDQLYAACGGRYGTVYILGGWYGVLGAMILSDSRFTVRRVLSIDIDPNCAPVAERINETQAREGRFEAVTGDVCRLEYAQDQTGTGLAGEIPDLVVNTSCEHMASTEAWYGRVPRGMLQAYQSNDYFDCPEHVNCSVDIAAFKRQLPMSDVLYEGTLPRRRYTRFMLIGRK